ADRSVTIRLEWRRPVARSSDGECWKGIDRSGAVFVLSGDGEGLPILALPDNARGAGEALAFLESLQQSKESWTQRLYKLKISADGEAVLMLAGETMVYWGDARTNLAEVGPKARRLQRVLDAPESAGGVESVRFVDDRRVVIKPRRAVVQRKETHG
ncbi:MAG: cell division protein FtsQ, partial [Elusimicrobia bacterium]|nr:cell division protein FtsQ [Elusimicrobiota bacterium]